MRKTVQIGNKLVGDNQNCFIIAEIGINHNGSVDKAKQLIDIAKFAGCDAVKFQKRTVDVVYTKEELERPRTSPFGETNGDLKRGLEFRYDEYKEIDEYCRQKDILWFASCWDEQSVDFIDQFDVPCYKIASASLTDDNLLLHTKSKGKPILLAAGMSSEEEIDHAVEILGEYNLILLQCTSTYPAENHELNLRVFKPFSAKYNCPIGHIGQVNGIMPSTTGRFPCSGVVYSHITWDRTMWGSDHSASLEPAGLIKLVRDIRNIPAILGSPNKTVLESEKAIMKKLRRVKNEICCN